MFSKALKFAPAAALAFSLLAVAPAAHAQEVVVSDWYGGSGGNGYGELCPEFSPWLTGIRANWGDWVDGLQGYCGSATETAWFGGFGGTATEDRKCPDGFVVTGIAPHWGDFLDGAHLLCTDLRDVAAGRAVTPIALDHFGGKSGSHSAYFTCPTGMAVMGIDGAADVYLDALRLICKRVN
jgi:hypothetical protein